MTTYTLWNQVNPGASTSGAGNNGTNGLHVTVSAPSVLNGIWHWSTSGSTQLPTSIGLYTITTLGTSGSLVHSETATWSGAAGSGWVFAPFTSPPVLQPGTDYMATQFRNDAVNEWFSFYAVTWPVTTGIITAPKDESTSALSQGWYNVGTAMTFPTTQSGTAGTNFGMDVSVSTTSASGQGSPSKRGQARKSKTALSKGLPVSGIIRDQTATGAAGTTSTSVVITWPNRPAAGSKAIVEFFVDSGSGGVTSVIDNGVVPSTFIPDLVLAPGAHSGKYIFRADNITLPASGSYHVTVTISGATTSFSLGAARTYLNVAPGPPISTNNGLGTASTSVATGNVTPNVAGALIVGGFNDSSSANPETITLTTSGANNIFTQTNGATLLAGAFADNITSSNAAQGLAWTLGDSVDWGAIVAVYAPASAPILHPVGPPVAQKGKVQHPQKSRTAASKGSPVVASPQASPFKPPTANKRHPNVGKARSPRSSGSVVVPGPVAPFKPPVKAVKGKPAARKSRTVYSPVPLVRATEPGFLTTESGTSLLTEAGGVLETEVPPSSVFSPPVSSRGKTNVRKSKSPSSGGSPVTLPVPVFPSPFVPPVKAVKGRASDSKSRQVKSSGSPVVPGPVAPFTPPNKAVKGDSFARKSKTVSSKGSPVVFPPTPSPFKPPKKAVKGDSSAQKSQTVSVKGSPLVLTPPSPFTPPPLPAKGSPVATKSRTATSKGSPVSVVPFQANFTAVGPIHSATANGFSLTPSSTAFGEFILLWVTSLTVADFATALTGSNMKWSVLVPHHAFSSGGSVVQTVFIGQPLTTAAQNQTITFNTGSPSVQVAWREFNCSAGFNAVSLDAVGFVDLATNGALPSVTPTHANDMYATSTWDASTGVAGNTPGFTYAIDVSNNHFAYNLQCSSSTQSPNIGDTNGTSGIGVMLSIAPSPKTPYPPRKYSKMRKSRTRHSPFPSTLRVPDNVTLNVAQVTQTAYTMSASFGAFAPTARIGVTAYPLVPLFPGGSSLLTASSTVTAYPVAELPVTYVHLAVAQVHVAAHTVNAIPPTPVPTAAATQVISAHRLFPPNPLLMSMTPNSGTDEFGNAYEAGFHLYNTSSRLSLSNNGPFGNNPNIQYLPGSTSNVTTQPTTFGWANNGGSSNQATWLIHSSGKTNSNDDAAIQLLGQAGDASSDAIMIFEFGGTVATALKKTGGFSSPGWTTATLINGWNSSGGGISGIFYRFNINGEIEVMGDVIHTSATGNSVAANLPSPYRGPYNMNHQAAWNNVAASNSASAPWIFTSASGDIQITGISVANKEIFFHIFIPAN